MFLQTIKGPFAEELPSSVRNIRRQNYVKFSNPPPELQYYLLAYPSYTRVQVLHMILLEGNEQRWALKH